MMDNIESVGKTRKEAIENGLKELGVDMHDVEKVDIIDEGSKGFLGIGARPVRVKLTVERPAQESRRGGGGDNRQPRQDKRGGSGDGRQKRQEPRGGGDRQEQRGRGDRQEQRQEQRGRGDRQESQEPRGRGDRQESQERQGRQSSKAADGDGGRRKKRRRRGGGGNQEDRSETPNGNNKGESDQRQEGNAHKATPIVDRKKRTVTEEATEALHLAEEFENNNDMTAPAENELPPNARPDDDIETITDEQGKEAAAMLSEMLDMMDLNGKVAFRRVSDGSAQLAIESEEDGGILIGKRGVTLHAIQYLVNRMLAQKDAADNTERVVVDVGNYVERRRNTLADMARNMAKRAKDSGRNVRLKPLSPQERRIVHLTLEDDPQVRTFSLGDSLFRSIVINPVGGRGGDERGGGRSSRGRRRNAGDAANTR